MLQRLLAMLGSATQVAPAYRPEFCIAVKKTVGACSACRDVCPHDAIVIDQRVKIDEADCAGCGLCIQACPSQALSAPQRLRADGALRCSQVDGNAQSVECLARLQATDLLRVAAGHERLTLARADCATCPVGGERVPAAIDDVVTEASALAAFRPRPLAITAGEAPKLSVEEKPSAISRRDLFQLGARGVREGALGALSTYDFEANGESAVPAELGRRFAWLRQAKPADEAKVPWVLPRVADACILCPVCTNVCPTHAFERELDPPDRGGVRLWLSPDLCSGCGACAASCPMKVITMDDEVEWGELRQAAIVKQDAIRRAVPA